MNMCSFKCCRDWVVSTVRYLVNRLHHVWTVHWIYTISGDWHYTIHVKSCILIARLVLARHPSSCVNESRGMECVRYVFNCLAPRQVNCKFWHDCMSSVAQSATVTVWPQRDSVGLIPCSEAADFQVNESSWTVCTSVRNRRGLWWWWWCWRIKWSFVKLSTELPHVSNELAVAVYKVSSAGARHVNIILNPQGGKYKSRENKCDPVKACDCALEIDTRKAFWCFRARWLDTWS